MAKSYVHPGYWNFGYAEGDQKLSGSVGKSAYVLNEYEECTVFPLVAFSSENPVTYSVRPALPSGLMINASTGAIYGAPAYLQKPIQYSIVAKDANYVSLSAQFTIEVVKDKSASVSVFDNVAIALSRIALQYRSQA